jgi:DNA-binding beta-propeller fold protein YncE
MQLGGHAELHTVNCAHSLHSMIHEAVSTMKRIAHSLAFLCLSGILHGQETMPGLTLKRTIPLPGVTGKFDHFALDRADNRLFASAAGAHAVEIIDLASGKVIDSLSGIGKPHGLAWIAAKKRLFVADGGKGELDIFDGSSLKRIATIALSEDADDMVYDDQTHLLYVGHGGTDAANPARVAVVDTETLKLVAELPVATHPEALEFDARHDRILVNIADSGQIAVIDGKSYEITAMWSLGQSKGNTPLAYDASHDLLLVGCRTPAQILVIDGKGGKVIAKASSDAGADDLFFDPQTRQAFLIAGSGSVDAYSVSMQGELTRLSVTHTAAGAKTGYLDEIGHVLYVGVPGVDGVAAVRVYATK